MGRTVTLAALCTVILAPGAADAQTYPEKAIQLIVPYQAGSAGDSMMRITSQKMAENMGQQIVIENVAGASGLIGAERVARAAPDGYTIGAINDSMLTFLPNVQKVPYDPMKSFEPVSMVAQVTYVLVVHPSLPARTLKEFIALAKARPGKIDFASGGSGNPQHIAMELFKSAAGISLTHVPYRGATQAVIDVVGGRVPVMFSAVAVVLPHIKEGKLRALAVPGAKRSPLLPDVPTVAEAGVPGFKYSVWTGIYLPRGTPKTIIDRLNAETAKAVADSAVRNRLLAIGLEPSSTTSDQLAEIARSGYATMAKIIKETGIKAE